jgi:hypothetical protein
MTDKVKSKVIHHLGESKTEKKGKKIHTHKLEIERADHGGHTLLHHMRDEDGMDAGKQTSVATDNDDMGEQVQSAMGDQPPAGQGAPPQQAPPDAGSGGADVGTPGQ